MFKLKNSVMFLVAALCGYLALMTPNWKTELTATVGGQYSNDINGDGIGDLLVRNSSNGAWKVYNFDNTLNVGAAQSTNLYTNTDYVTQALADLDGDGDDDVLTRRTSNGSWPAFYMNGNSSSSNALVGIFASTDWQFRGALDANADGIDDILLRRSSDNKWRLFLFDNTGDVASSSAPTLPYVAADWTYRGTGDFDGDGDDDVLERRDSDGKWRVFYSAAGNITTTNTLNKAWTAADVTVQGVGDMDGDGDTDYLTRKTSDSKWHVAAFVGGVVDSTTITNMYTNSAWEFQSLADYDGDGDTDVVMRRNTDGAWRSFRTDAGGLYGGTTNTLGVYTASNWTLKNHR